MKNQRGFTLIEVVVATAIFGIATASLFALLSRSLANLKKIEDIRHYQLAGEDIMSRTLLLSKLPAGGSIDGELQRPAAHWTVKITPWIPSTLDSRPPDAVMKIDVEVRWQGRSTQRSLTLEALKAGPVSYANDDFKQAIENALPQ